MVSVCVIVWQHTSCAQVFVCGQPHGHRSWIASCIDAATVGSVGVVVKMRADLSPKSKKKKKKEKVWIRPKDLQPTPTHKRTCLSPHSLLILASCAACGGEHPSPLAAETAETLPRTMDQ